MTLAAIWRPRRKNAAAALTDSSPALSDAVDSTLQGPLRETVDGARARTGRFTRMKRGTDQKVDA
jgi:hypothetical protein